MNIASSSSPLPTSVRPDAAQGPTRMTLGADTESVDPVSVPDDGTQDFGRMLSQSIAKDAGSPADRNARTTDKGDVAQDAATAILPDATTAPPNAAKIDDAADAKAATDAPLGDDLAAQLALVSQWAAFPTQLAPPTTGHIVPSTEGTDIKTKLDTVRGTAVGATALRAADAGKAVADAAIRDAKTATTGADAQVAVTPFAIAGAAQALERSMRPAASTSTTGIVASAKSDAKQADGTAAIAASIDASASRPSVTASIERLFAMAAATEPAAAGSTSAGDQAAAANAFVSQVAAQVSNAASDPTTAPAATSIVLHEQVGTPAWSHEVGHAALRMAANDVQNVSLHLNPEHLGPMEIQMRIDQGVAHLQFTATHADTRHALESSRTTLDQMFAAQGLKLGDCSVGQQSANSAFARNFGAASQGGGRNGTAGGDGTADDGVVTATVTTRATRAVGLVDTFA